MTAMVLSSLSMSISFSFLPFHHLCGCLTIVPLSRCVWLEAASARVVALHVLLRQAGTRSGFEEILERTSFIALLLHLVREDADTYAVFC